MFVDVQAAQRGDTRAFERLVAHHQHHVCALTTAVTGDPQSGEDVAQHTFVLAWSRLGELREPAHFRTWLRAIAKRLALNGIRGEKRRRRTESSSSVEPTSESPEVLVERERERQQV